MKTIATLAVWALAAGQGAAQQTYPVPADVQTFYMYFLNTGPNSGKGTPEERKEIQAQHMAHLNSLGDAGKIGGPFVNGGERRGLVILKADSLDAARAIGEADPAVKAGTFTVETYTLMVPGNWFAFGPVPERYTMRRFVFFFLDDAPGRPADTPAEEMAKLQDAHLANLHRLSREGKLHLAGPLPDGGAHRGIGVMATEDIEEARTWMADDPLVKGGYLVMVPLQWFAADGILLRK
jgi:uncharacterized protein YciI